MDFITHLPKTQAGHTALYVVVDRLTKLVHIAPTTDNATAEENSTAVPGLDLQAPWAATEYCVRQGRQVQQLLEVIL